MNLGIVIAVSNYGSLGNNLPGCKVDGQAIAQILKTDKKFDDVLIVTDETHSGNVKPELISFINRHKESDIEDIVFYFTGHGDFSGDEFYFLLSDYDKKRKKQTCLENTELDNLLKTLCPNNAIKIVDACHSGTPYIKDPDAFDTYLKGTQAEFKKCYFMFSSQTDQYSYQDAHLSFFTRSIVESIFNHTSDTVRYKDVIDYVSDSFSENTSQTPFFIVQAEFTEPFCTLSSTLKNSLGEVLSENKTIAPQEDNENKSLLDLVKDDAEKYCTEEQAMEYLKKFLTCIKQSVLDKDISNLYDLIFEEENDYSEIPSSASIGKWLESNDHSFFAEPYKEKVNVRRRKSSLSYRMGILAGVDDDDNNYVIKSEMRTKGFRSTVDLPVKLLKVTAEAKYPNIESALAYVVPIISKTELRVFFSFNVYEPQGWSEKKIGNTVEWVTDLIELSHEHGHTELSQKIMMEYSKFIYTAVAGKFSLTDDKDENPDNKKS